MELENLRTAAELYICKYDFANHTNLEQQGFELACDTVTILGGNASGKETKTEI